MSSNYVKNASSNRDALFGGSGAPSGKKKSSKTSAKPAPSRPKPPSISVEQPSPAKRAPIKQKKPQLSADAIAAKTKQAEEFTAKANNCMRKTLFSSPDPVSASTFFKRAAECYKSLGDPTKERLYRIESATCNRQCNAWSSAAADYTRAAELAATEENDPITANRFHVAAAGCWRESGEAGKAAASQTAAAVVLLEAETSDQHVSSSTLAALEEAVEAHVPDPLNPTARYRQTGSSLFDPGDTELAQQHRVTTPYAHESVQSIVIAAAERRLFPTALYAAGAVSTLLGADGLATISLARAFWVETILFLAMGDPVAANQAFMERHLQVDSYLRSRECAAAEDIIRAVQQRDAELLDQLRTKDHRGAVGQLPRALQGICMGLRVAGVAKLPTTTKSTTEPVDATKPLEDVLQAKTGYEGEGGNNVATNLDAELDALDFGDDDDDDKSDDDELDALEDDDIDLR